MKHPFSTVIAGAIIIIISSCTQAVPVDNTDKTNNADKADTVAKIDKIDKVANADTAKAQANPFDNTKMEVKTYQTEELVKRTDGKSDRGWGYDVLVDGKVYVHQPHIPAVSGNRSFRSSEDAKKTAALVIYKLKNNIVPPSLSVEELDSIGVTK